MLICPENDNKRVLGKRKRKIPSVLKVKKPKVVLAKRNGEETKLPVRVVGFNMDEILTNSTLLLDLTSTARVLYDIKGHMLQDIDDITNGSLIYVSQGEPFVDPVKQIKERVIRQNSSFLGFRGIYTPEDVKIRHQSATSGREVKVEYSPKRRKYRITVIFVEKPDEIFEIVSSDIKEFQWQCSEKDLYHRLCKNIYLSDMSLVNDFSDIINADENWNWSLNKQGAVYGPVWVTLSSQMDVEVIKKYFHDKCVEIQGHLKQNEEYMKELEAAKKGEKDKVNSDEVKSYHAKELKYWINKTKRKVAELKEDLKKFKQKLRTAKDLQNKTVESNSKKDEYSGLRLKAYINSKQNDDGFSVYFNRWRATKGISDPQVSFNILLDELTQKYNVVKENDCTKGILVRRIFTREGTEIFDVKSLKFDDTIYISFGEDFIHDSQFVLTATPHHLSNDLTKIVDQIDVTSENLKKFTKFDHKLDDELLKDVGILQHKENKNTNILFSASVSERIKSAKKDSFQTWLYTKKGQIIPMCIPSLCLTLIDNSERNNNQNEKDNKTEDFYPVQLCAVSKRDDDNYSQIWEFRKNGLLANKAYPNFFLTFDEKIESTGTMVTNLVQLRRSNLMAAKSSANQTNSIPPANQRWALRQCCFSDMSQWRQCYLANPEWHKKGLTWPLDEDGDINENLNWPLKCFLLPNAPSQRSFCKIEERYPRVLYVFRNGNPRMEVPVLVVGPDFTKFQRSNSVSESDVDLHCLEWDMGKLEFNMFLDNCTSMMKLESVARRIFLENGQEIWKLSRVKNKQVVYVSCGESFCTPSLASSKFTLRSYLQKLTVDIERLRCFIRLSENVDDYVLGIWNKLEELELGGTPLPGMLLKEQLQRNRKSQNVTRRSSVEEEEEEEEDVAKSERSETLPHQLTCHEKKCEAARLKKDNGKNETDETTNMEAKTDQMKRENSESVLWSRKKLIRQDQFITSTFNDKFHLFAVNIDQPVELRENRNVLCEDNQFKWIFHSNGTIESKHFRGYVLSWNCNRMLPFESKSSFNYVDSALTLEKAIVAKNGKIHQRFRVDKSMNVIFCLAGTSLDLRTTAAILSGICTKYVSKEPISQPTYHAAIKKHQKVICQSCVSILNGRYCIQEDVQGRTEPFICSYGGGFKVLRELEPDLSSEGIMQFYQDCCNRVDSIKRKLLLKPLPSRITKASPNIYALLYLNGRGRKDKPKLTSGKTIKQILDNATHLYQLSRSARILYTVEGIPISDYISYRNYVANIVTTESTAAVRDDDDDSVRQKLDDNNESDIKQQDNVPVPPITKKESKKQDEKLIITLSQDESYFIVEQKGVTTSQYFQLCIKISNVSDFNQFLEDSSDDSYLLINYDIFDNQINTSLFKTDEDFDTEDVMITIRSSPQNLVRLFEQEMPSLRLQVVKVLITKSKSTGSSTDDDMPDFDIQSIDAIADIQLATLAKEMMSNNYKIEKPITISEDCLMLTTDTFTPSTASLCMDVSLTPVAAIASSQMQRNEDAEIGQKLPEDKEEEEESVDMQDKHSNSTLIDEPPIPASNYNNPLELWVSQGENFVFPTNQPSSARSDTKQKRDLKSELDNKKMLLRMKKGERLKSCNPGKLETTAKQENPVVIKDNWQFPTRVEMDLKKEISKLEIQLKSRSRSEPVRTIDLKRDLYKQKHYKKLLLRKNGDCDRNVVPVWAESIYELKEIAMKHFNIKQLPNYVFNSKGQKVQELSELQPEEIVTVSKHNEYQSMKFKQLEVEIKANWARARRLNGPQATEIESQIRINTLIDADPFEPHILLTNSIELPAKQRKVISVFENGKNDKEVVIEGRTLSELLNKAQEVLNLSLPVKCFYTGSGRQIISFREILDDDKLAASVSGTGLLRFEE